MIRSGSPTPSAEAQPPPARSAFGLRVGIDIQGIADIEDSIRRHGRRYLNRVFSAQEVSSCGGYEAEPNLLAPGLAARFSAKEAVLKALRPSTVIPEWRDIEIVSMPGGWLTVQLSGAAREIAAESSLSEMEVSVSHDGPVAVATAVCLESRQAAA